MTILRGRPFFGGESTNFQVAFPNVEKLDLTIEREERFHDGRLGCEWSTHSYNETNVPDQITCSSYICRRGGYDILYLLRYLESKRKPGENEVSVENQYFRCAGDHGSPQGRRKGSPCSIGFKVNATMTFKASQKAL